MIILTGLRGFSTTVLTSLHFIISSMYGWRYTWLSHLWEAFLESGALSETIKAGYALTRKIKDFVPQRRKISTTHDYFFLPCYSPKRAPAFFFFFRFLYYKKSRVHTHTHTHTHSVGLFWTSNQPIAQHTKNTREEPAIRAIMWQQTCALDRMATRIGFMINP